VPLRDKEKEDDMCGKATKGAAREKASESDREKAQEGEEVSLRRVEEEEVAHVARPQEV